jgi:copper transport protein
LKKLFAAVLALLVVTSGAPAFAHAELTGASPKANVILKKAPQEIRLTFDDDLIPILESNQIAVTNSKNVRVDKNDSTVLGNQLRTSLKKTTTRKISSYVSSAIGRWPPNCLEVQLHN